MVWVVLGVFGDNGFGMVFGIFVAGKDSSIVAMGRGSFEMFWGVWWEVYIRVYGEE